MQHRWWCGLVCCRCGCCQRRRSRSCCFCCCFESLKKRVIGINSSVSVAVYVYVCECVSCVVCVFISSIFCYCLILVYYICDVYYSLLHCAGSIYFIHTQTHTLIGIFIFSFVQLFFLRLIFSCVRALTAPLPTVQFHKYKPSMRTHDKKQQQHITHFNLNT